MIIDGGILAGGRASRMGGLDKGLQVFRGQPMAQWVADALSPHVDTLWINTHTNQQEYKNISAYLCADLVSGQPGPLAGLQSLLHHTRAEYLLTSPCDTPLLGPIYAERMLATLQSLQSTDNPPVLAVKACGRFHCLHLCVPKSCLTSLTNYLSNGQQKVFTWLESLDIVWVDFTDVASNFDNINYQHQLD